MLDSLIEEFYGDLLLTRDVSVNAARNGQLGELLCEGLSVGISTVDSDTADVKALTLEDLADDRAALDRHARNADDGYVDLCGERGVLNGQLFDSCRRGVDRSDGQLLKRNGIVGAVAVAYRRLYRRGVDRTADHYLANEALGVQYRQRHRTDDLYLIRDRKALIADRKSLFTVARAVYRADREVERRDVLGGVVGVDDRDRNVRGVKRRADRYLGGDRVGEHLDIGDVDDRDGQACAHILISDGERLVSRRRGIDARNGDVCDGQTLDRSVTVDSLDLKRRGVVYLTPLDRRGDRARNYSYRLENDLFFDHVDRKGGAYVFIGDLDRFRACSRRIGQVYCDVIVPYDAGRAVVIVYCDLDVREIGGVTNRKLGLHRVCNDGDSRDRRVRGGRRSGARGKSQRQREDRQK